MHPFALLALFAAEPAAPSFLNEVVPILTRQGCNQGACHGKGAGQNGFRLSLRGYAPDEDYKSIVREFAGRRINPADPERSILLTKPTGRAPHAGGALFGEQSREYRTLLAWLRAGRPGPDAKEPTLVRLEVTPGAVAAERGKGVPLTAWATYSDGSRRDVTWLTKFEANDAGTVPVTPAGVATAVRPGEAAIRASFLTEVAVSTFTLPFPDAIDAAKFAHAPHAIDDAVFAKLRGLRIEPSPLSSDAEFLRRAYLDAIGTLPTPEEARAFLADAAPDKRVRLIDELLARPEWVDYWTLQLADVLQNRRERDHDARGAKGVRSFHAWLRKRVADNRPWDETARLVLTATGDAQGSPGVGYFLVAVGEQREAEKSEVVAGVAQAFLGTRIGCAQCHNHPLERYTQDDYYHFAGFFTRLALDRKEPKEGVTRLRISGPDPGRNGEPVGARQPRTGQLLEPRPLDRSATPVSPGDDPRVKLARWMTDPSNTAFSGAMANRVWRHYMGAGVVEPVDDLRATNPPTNAALWAALNRHFVGSGFDLKALQRLILTSRAYQLASATTPGNRADTKYYSHYLARRMPAEVLLDALCQATGVQEHFPGYPDGIRAVQLPEVGNDQYFLGLFGKSARVTACACERAGDVTLPQLMHLQAGEGLTEKLRANWGHLHRWLGEQPDDARLIDTLYLAALSRPATPAERDALLKARAESGDRAEFFRDLYWALLNSKAFTFIH